MQKQVIVTTIFGPQAETLETTFASFAKVPDAELHAFVYNDALPNHRHPKIQYHLVKPDPAFRSIRRDALFRRWTLPDTLGAEFALVVDGTDALCIHPLPPFASLLRGASIAAATEWGKPVRILGQGYTSAYLNAGVTFWHLPSSLEMRKEIEARGRAHYRGPFDDQTTLNEVVHTCYPGDLTILPSQFNWRAYYQKSYRNWHRQWRTWPRVDCLDGVYIYHNADCIQKVLASIEEFPPKSKAELKPLPQDKRSLSWGALFWRRIAHRLRHT